jgi:hypothetical protein
VLSVLCRLRVGHTPSPVIPSLQSGRPLQDNRLNPGENAERWISQETQGEASEEVKDLKPKKENTAITNSEHINQFELNMVFPGNNGTKGAITFQHRYNQPAVPLYTRTYSQTSSTKYASLHLLIALPHGVRQISETINSGQMRAI